MVSLRKEERKSIPHRKWPVIHSSGKNSISLRYNRAIRQAGAQIWYWSTLVPPGIYIYPYKSVMSEMRSVTFCMIYARGYELKFHVITRFSSATYRDSWHDNMRMRIGGVRKWWIILSEISFSLTGCWLHARPSIMLSSVMDMHLRTGNE